MGSYAAGWPFAGNRTSTQYSRENIREWLQNYPSVFWSSEGETSIRLAEVKIDIDMAVDCQPPHLRQFFFLYCVEGYEFEEIRIRKGWTTRVCNDYWTKLQRGVANLMCDPTHAQINLARLNQLSAVMGDLKSRSKVPHTDHGEEPGGPH